ncbi:MAG: glycosyltransferase family 9 protein [Chloroflexota bacterium]|nr:glycosyltransferase family 9 protein [Chloroflexota bacterium]
MPPNGWENVRRILAIRLDNIGDVVMLGPALRTLRQALPEASITLMASPGGSQVASLLPWVDDVMVHRAIWQDASGTMPLDPAREQALVETIWARGFDAAVIFTSFSQSPYPPAYVCYLAGVPVRLGQSKEFGGSLLSQSVKPLPDDVHQVDRNLHLLESAGFSVAGRHLELSVPSDIQSKADCLLCHIGVDPYAPFIVLAPGASCAARRYNPLRYAAMVPMLATQTGLPIVVIGSTCEAELVAPILAAGSKYGISSLVGQTSVPELAAIIRRAALVVANDSGPMHLADAFQRSMVILYSGTEYESQWRPRSAPTKLLRRPTDCSPCYRFQCPYQMECLDIPPTEVVAEALVLLEWTANVAAQSGR